MTRPTDDPRGRPPVSCYIRTLNEAVRIGPVLEGAFKAAREVVVVDSGSTDGTIDIAKAAGARVIHNDWPGNGFQKRFGEEACTYDWLLDLDGDEVVTDELADAIKALFADGKEPGNPVYGLKMLTKPPDFPVWEKAWVVRRNKLYDRRRLRMPAHEAWDQLDLPDGVTAEPLPGHIIHHQFLGFDHLAQKANSWSAMRARYMKPRPMWQLKLRILFAYPFYFLKYFLSKGLWRAGVYGFAIAGISGYSTWLRDVRMYEAQLKKSRENA